MFLEKAVLRKQNWKYIFWKRNFENVVSRESNFENIFWDGNFDNVSIVPCIVSCIFYPLGYSFVW